MQLYSNMLRITNKYFCLTILLKSAFILLTFITNSCAANRDKRYIYYPYGGSYKLVLGVSIPVMIPAEHQTLGFATNIQFQYPQVTNLSQVQQNLPPILTRKKRFAKFGNEWKLTYQVMETMMQKYGTNGKQCLLRSICENAMHPLHHESNGLYGQLLHIILTPNYGGNMTVPDIDGEYLEAQRAGEFGVDCLSLFPACPLGHSLLDLISILE